MPATTTSSSSGPPCHFLCPITLEVMVHPMLAPDGRRYERFAILEWTWFGGGTSPWTRELLHPDQLEEDLVLKKEIEQWRQEHGIPEPVHYVTDDEEEEDEVEEEDEEEEGDCLEAEDTTDSDVSKTLGAADQGMPPRLMNLRNRILLQVQQTRCREEARRRLSKEKLLAKAETK